MWSWNNITRMFTETPNIPRPTPIMIEQHFESVPDQRTFRWEHNPSNLTIKVDGIELDPDQYTADGNIVIFKDGFNEGHSIHMVSVTASVLDSLPDYRRQEYDSPYRDYLQDWTTTLSETTTTTDTTSNTTVMSNAPLTRLNVERAHHQLQNQIANTNAFRDLDLERFRTMNTPVQRSQLQENCQRGDIRLYKGRLNVYDGESWRTASDPDIPKFVDNIIEELREAIAELQTTKEKAKEFRNQVNPNIVEDTDNIDELI